MQLKCHFFHTSCPNTPHTPEEEVILINPDKELLKEKNHVLFIFAFIATTLSLK